MHEDKKERMRRGKMRRIKHKEKKSKKLTNRGKINVY